MTTEPNSLAETLSAHQLDLPQEQIQTLDRYRALLWKWNERLNLTRHTTLEKFVTRDVLDSLELAKLIDKGQRVLDVGTGGGVPGMILCICRPDLSVTVCDSVQKKAKVVQTMVEELQLPVQVLARRVEDVLQKQTFHSLVARGVAPLPKMLRWLEPHWSAFEELLLIKGQGWIEERGEARHLGLLKPLELRKVASYLTFGTDRESVILSLRAECD